jgi:tetratricopeptide (TPR) repeat protein
VIEGVSTLAAGSSPEGLREREAALRAEARGLVEQGDLRGAEAIYLRCEAIAQELGDVELRELATCNLASVRISYGSAEEPITALRAILLATKSDNNAFLAAYTASRHYELKKEYKKSLFYGRIALEKLERLDNQGWVAGARNQVGNALLATSDVRGAVREYQAARGLVASDSLLGGIFLLNLGYCDVLEGRVREGAAKLMRALRLTRHHGARLQEAQARMDLSFAYLELGRVAGASRQACRALELARELGWNQGLKNALYLVGESARLSGEFDRAEEVFNELQTAFYPDQPYLRTLLMAVDVRRMLNLHA